MVTPAVEARFQHVTDPSRLAEVRSRYHLPRQFVLGVGTLEPRKNLAALIAAYGQLCRASGLQHGLVIAGKPGWLYDGIFEQVKREGLEERVLLTGFVADEDLPTLYSLAELFVFPSLYEGFGIPVLEAMACGTPVITADNSSLPEAAGDAAMLVDAHDIGGLAEAMARTIEDRALRVRMVDAGFAWAAHFTWQRSAQALLEAYKAATA